MLIKTKAIVFSCVKYQEKSLIVKCFTQSSGLKSYFVRDAFSSRKTSQKIAYFQPLTILEIEAVHKNKGGLENFKEVKIAVPLTSIHSNIFKSTIALFVSEILHLAVREEEKNEPLFSYLENALQWLDHNQEITNFHLILMLDLTKYLGFFPDTATVEKPFFSVTEGVFTNIESVNSLAESETHLFKKLLTVQFQNRQKVFNSSDRQVLLKVLINYYGVHLQSFKPPKSLEVLKEVFS